MHRPRLIFVLSLLLLVQSALGQSADFELWTSAWPRWDTDGTIPSPPPLPNKWHGAIWTTGITTAVSTAQDVKNLAHLCRYGGNSKDWVNQQTWNYLNYYKRWWCFPDPLHIPKNTLLVLDYEGAEATKYPELLWENTRSITKRYAQYPSLGMTGDVNEGIAWPWTSQLREVDFFCIARVWSRATPRYIANCGDYVLVELYVNEDPATQEQQYRVWSVLIASLRARLPDKKILGLVCSYHPWPSTTLLTVDERHRLERLLMLCNGCWLWGPFDADLPSDIAVLADDSLHQFAGEEKWGRE